MKKSFFLCFVLSLLLWSFAASASSNQYLQLFESKVTKFELKNGLTFLVIERHKMPVVSFVSFFEVGSVNEPRGNTGIAHILEHMAFKGTPTIGTSNWSKERKLLDKVDKAYRRWLQEKYSSRPDQEKLAGLRNQFENLRQQAKQYVLANEFSKIIERNGGHHLNAATSKDYTVYFCSLPSNRAELWFSLESDRLMNPVWREFYTEKEVVLEERRMRVDSSPTGRLIEELLSVAYKAHPYRNPTIGWTTDIISTTISDLDQFYRRHYVAGNITVAIAGDISPEQVRTWAKTYFGSFRTKEDSLEVVTREPEQKAERRFIFKEPSRPYYVRAYHAVDQDDPDYPALELLADILSSGRTSRFYKQIVVKKELATEVSAFTGFPGDKYQSLFTVFGVPSKGVSLSSLSQAIDKELDKVKQGRITKQELDRAKTKVRAGLIRGLDSNLGLARSFAKAEAQQGDWRKVFTHLDRIQLVTLEDIQNVANRYLNIENRTVGEIIYAKPNED